jgi:hypothetical protein
MNTDAFLLLLIKVLGALAFAIWLIFRFLRAVTKEFLDFRDWWLAERRTRGSPPT